jgi:hypothetical protein
MRLLVPCYGRSVSSRWWSASWSTGGFNPKTRLHAPPSPQSSPPPVVHMSRLGSRSGESEDQPGNLLRLVHLHVVPRTGEQEELGVAAARGGV